MTTTESKWAARVAAWRSSGKTAEAFAEGQGFAPSTLRYWASKLRASSEVSRSVPMVRVVRPEVARVETRLEVAIGAARISVARGFDAELLREVVAALGVAR